MGGKARHLAGAGIGLACSPALAFLVIQGVSRTRFFTDVLLSRPAPGGIGLSPPGLLGPAPGAVPLAALLFVAAAVLAGLLASMPWISPVAPAVAAVPLIAVDLYAHSSALAFVDITARAPFTGWNPAWQEVIGSRALLLLGGALAISAMAPWRWRAGAERARWADRHPVGVFLGIVALAGLWLVLQVSDASFGTTASPVRLFFRDEFLLLIVLGAVVVGLLTSARWLSPLAAVIAGAPLLAVGLLMLLAPSMAQGAIDRVVYGPVWQAATEDLAASGLLVLVGGMLLTSAAVPGRWRGLARPAIADAQPTPGVPLGV
jgi:hypothetical protein